MMKHAFKIDLFKKGNTVQVKINNNTILQSDIFSLNKIDDSITIGAIKTE